MQTERTPIAESRFYAKSAFGGAKIKLMKELEIVREKLQNKYRVVKTDEDLEWNRAIDLCTNIINAHIKHMNDGWIPVEERLPKEHDSIFAKWKGTDKWSKSMFEKTSGDVNVTVEYEDGKRKTITAHTVDGKWVLPNRIIKQKVIAWRPLPDPYHPERSERK